jgi:anti-sigma factor RsiW
MRCKKVLERLDEHVDGLLPAPQAEAIRDHLDDCGDCRETALALKASSASLCAWDEAPLPDGCFDKILERIESLPPEALDRPVRRRLGPLTPGFVVVDVARLRRVATGGLAAAAAVLGALVVTRTDTRVVRRPRAPAAAPSVAATWYQDAQFDNGLFYEQGGRKARPRSIREDELEAVVPR